MNNLLVSSCCYCYMSSRVLVGFFLLGPLLKLGGSKDNVDEAAEQIDGTSQANMKYCGTGMEDNFTFGFFRMAY